MNIKDKESGKEVIFWVVVLVVMLVFGRPFANFIGDLDNPEIVKNFKDGKTYICSSGGGIYSSGTKFIVNKARGWSVYKDDYFVKDDIRVNLRRCEEESK